MKRLPTATTAGRRASAKRVREIFETDCDVYFVLNGTAANALALAQLCRSFHSIICHDHSHLQTDECGAPEFFTNGSKLLLIGGRDGKIDIDEAEAIVARQCELHSHKPRAISITQSTEFGTVYTPAEIAAIGDFARRREMFVHMDGARFANAVASLSCAPKQITWQIGVDVLCFGGTKNGVAAGELVVFFKKDLAREFDYRVKQAGQLGSKMRFVAAPWLGLLNDKVWLRNAQHANRAAKQLADQLKTEAKIDIVFPVEANAVFLRMSEHIVADLQERGWHFYKFIEPDVYRLMCSWSVTDRDIAQFTADLRGFKTDVNQLRQTVAWAKDICIRRRVKALVRVLFSSGIFLAGCGAAHDVVVTSYHVVSAPVKFVHRQINKPPTTTTTTTTTSDVTNPGRPVPPTGLVFATATRCQREYAPASPAASPRTSRKSTVEAKPKPSPSPHVSSVQPDFPTAKSVPDKPGYVYSPSDPKKYVDVSGYAPGSKVKDPYSGKIFLVP